VEAHALINITNARVKYGSRAYLNVGSQKMTHGKMQKDCSVYCTLTIPFVAAILKQIYGS